MLSATLLMNWTVSFIKSIGVDSPLKPILAYTVL
jgi:hypothetical protein